DEIDEFNERNLQSFSTASSLPALVEFLGLNEDERQDIEIRETARATMLTLLLYPYDAFNTSSFALLDLEGHNILDTFRGYEGSYEGDREYFTSSLISGNAYVS